MTRQQFHLARKDQAAAPEPFTRAARDLFPHELTHDVRRLVRPSVGAIPGVLSPSGGINVETEGIVSGALPSQIADAPLSPPDTGHGKDHHSHHHHHSLQVHPAGDNEATERHLPAVISPVAHHHQQATDEKV